VSEIEGRTGARFFCSGDDAYENFLYIYSSQSAEIKASLIVTCRLLTRLTINHVLEGGMDLELIKIPLANLQIPAVVLHTSLKSLGVRIARIRPCSLLVCCSSSRWSSSSSLSLRRGGATSEHARQTMPDSMPDSYPRSCGNDVGEHSTTLLGDGRRLSCSCGWGCSGRGCLLSASGDRRGGAGLLLGWPGRCRRRASRRSGASSSTVSLSKGN